MFQVKDLHGDTPLDELTREQLLERLEGAKLVVENLQKQAEEARIIHSAVAEECARRGDKMERYAFRLRGLARDLSRCGQHDHKSKNEIILDAVHTLLCWADDLPIRTLAQDMDDIPF